VKKIIWSLVILSFITACSSGVKLNDVPVEDKAGASVKSNPQAQDAAKSSPTSSSSTATTSNNGTSNSNNNASNSLNASATSQDAKSSSSPVSSSTTDTGTAGPANATKVIYFDYDSYIVKPEYQAVIELHAQYLKANQRSKVSLEGHTDERGSREYNLALGQKRADAVRQSLTLLGVNAAQIESVSFGEEKPAVAGSDESAYAKNRRAEFFYK
jgi:peptidoglycan-associated lipoprotein